MRQNVSFHISKRFCIFVYIMPYIPTVINPVVCSVKGNPFYWTNTVFNTYITKREVNELLLLLAQFNKLTRSKIISNNILQIHPMNCMSIVLKKFQKSNSYTAIPLENSSKAWQYRVMATRASASKVNSTPYRTLGFPPSSVVASESSLYLESQDFNWLLNYLQS